MFIEILFQMLLFKGGVLIYAEHCTFVLFNIFNYCCVRHVLNLHFILFSFILMNTKSVFFCEWDELMHIHI